MRIALVYTPVYGYIHRRHRRPERVDAVASRRTCKLSGGSVGTNVCSS